ncbi:MAG TPA: S8/S53 family peptidase, partial [Candidatus Thermoplasmatota archaeon]|nr:S8/S53 family peptidase [Candidatus Thermoplasmatota archaeon]
GLVRVVGTLDWADNTPLAENFDLTFRHLSRSETAATGAKPEVLVVQAPAPGAWSARVDARLAANTAWHLDVVGVALEGASVLPGLSLNAPVATPGATVVLRATVEAAPGATVAWETDPGSRRFDDGTGPELALTFTGPQVVRAKVTDAEGHEVVAETLVRSGAPPSRPVTIVAVIDGSFSPYHYDFLGAQHPWNLDPDPTNDIDFTQHLSAHLPGIPPAEALPITLPTGPNDNVDTLRLVTDAEVWKTMQRSTAAAPKPYWFPGTKVVAALRFGPEAFQGSNAAHGTASASVAAGNVHGTCPECLFVLLNGNYDEALRWASAQPWIDVVTNSYGSGSIVQSLSGGRTRDNMYWGSPIDATRDASEAGQVIVFSAGNGFLNAYDAPMLTYWSSQKGPDWVVTVGAVAANSRQTYSGAGKPVDVSSIGNAYPASGGTTANGAGTHSGTSNAAPVTAGTFAKVLQAARESLGDLTPGHADGVVASGPALACGAAVPACALGDGVLTRVELERAVYASVAPSRTVLAVDLVWPTTEHAYYYQGHGVLQGRIAGEAGWTAEWGRILGHLRGDAPAQPRSEAAANWFLVDSKCRQHLWGAWSGAAWQGQPIALDPVRDPIASTFHAWCGALPERPFLAADKALP